MGLRERLADQLIGQVEVNLQGGKGLRPRSLGRCSVACRQVRPKLGDLGGDQLCRKQAFDSATKAWVRSRSTPVPVSACKPSTGRLLVRYGVNARYPLDPQLNGWLPQKIVAAGCRNPDSAAVLVEAGLAPINELDDGGRTVLDEALARPYRPMMQAALRALGGLPGAEVDASGRVARMVELREGYDLDLEQSERE